MATTRRFVSLLAVIATSTLANSQPTVWYVDPGATQGLRTGTSWRNAFEDLQDALDPNVAQSGDQIWVANGVYRPSVEFCIDCPATNYRHRTFRIPSGVSLYGGFLGVTDPNDPNSGETFLGQRNEDDPDHWTILEGDPNFALPNDPASPHGVYHVVTAVNVSRFTKLSGFMIRGGNADSTDPNLVYEGVGGGILIVGTSIGELHIPSSLQVTRCTIVHNAALIAGAGIALDWSANPVEPDDPNDPNDPNRTFDPNNPADVLPARVVNCRL